MLQEDIPRAETEEPQAEMIDSTKRKSSRERTTTSKMNEYLKEEVAKRGKQFDSRYQAFKVILKVSRNAAKKDLEEKEILAHQTAIDSELEKLSTIYDEIRKLEMPSQHLRQMMDAAAALAGDMRRVLQELLIVDDMSEKGRKYLLRQPLRRDYAHSVYGSTVSRVTKWTRTDGNVDIEAERRLTEAELAAKVEKIARDKEISIQRQKLEDLEKERDVRVLEAKLKVLSVDDDDDIATPPIPTLNPSAGEFLPCRAPVASGGDGGLGVVAGSGAEKTMLQAITDSIQTAHLPVPTPPIFKGDPLEYADFKTSFMDMIHDHNIPPRRKLHYLKQYVHGPARSAIAGCFYGTSEEAYQQAWHILDKRYGRPFVVQEALGQRLENWPVIGNNDSKGLEKFADFLGTCLDAMPYVKGLSYLNDYKENKRLKSKLPGRCAARWTRYVTDVQQDSDEFPSFAQFVKFVSKEAEVANHPISGHNREGDTNASSTRRNKSQRSFHSLATAGNERIPRPRQRNQGKPSFESNSCLMCDNKSHRIWNCQVFKGKPVDQRSKIAVEKHLCFRCLRKGHSSRKCENQLRCRTCQGRHHTLLHKDMSNPSQGLPETEETTPKVVQTRDAAMSSSAEQEAVSCRTQTSSSTVCTSMIVPVWVSTEGDEGEVLTYALLDTQSDCSYITEELMSKLQAPYHPVKMKLSTLTSTSSITCKKLQNLKLRGWNKNTTVKLNSCYSRDMIPCNRAHIPTRRTAEQLHHLQDIANCLPPLQDCEVGLLIGYDCPQALAPRDTIAGEDDGPFAIKTDLGWSVIGGQSDSPYEDYHHCHRVIAKEVPHVSPKDVLAILEQDFNDKSVDETCHSQQDIKFLSCLEKEITFNPDGHLSMPLPFKKSPELPNNFGYAKIRLEHLKKKLIKDPTYREHYTSFMEDMVLKGYAEKVPPGNDDVKVNYIPHHGVYHPQKPNKIRVVFDCSAKCKGTSLNDQLLKGPDLSNSLIGVLMRFREENIALVCDIEKMFYQFNVKTEDRDWLRYLWWENGDLLKSPSEYRMRVHLFGAASSPGCANYGLKYLAKEYEDKYPEAAKFLSQNFYVDDGLQSVESTDMAIKLIKNSVELCKQGKIRLHKFLSNDKQVLQCIPASECATAVSALNLEFDELPTERTLGINWNVAEDSFNFKVILKEHPTTRRGILATVASIYDPLGFVAPIVLTGKQILQKLCQNGIKWDDQLEENLRPQWEQWKMQLQDLENLSIPRCYKPSDFGKVYKAELHHFSDASLSGYGQCSYLRLIAQDGRVHCSLVMAKSRVTPTKITTIPRLELAAAVTSVRIAALIKKELDVCLTEEIFWTDSKVVLGYLANEARRFHVFVGNRVQYIKERTSTSQWRYVASSDNPADIASRGMTVKALMESQWFTGPRFLWKPEIPNESIDCDLTLGDPEVKANVLSTQATVERTNLLDSIMKFSDWNRMVRVIATLRRWFKGRESVVKENEDATKLILLMLQEQKFSRDIAEIKRNTLPRNSRMAGLNPYIDEFGLIRVGGRLGKADASENFKHPIILPQESKIIDAITRHVHQQISHQGRGQTLNEIRARGFWIMGGSRIVGRIIRGCVTCRKLRRPLEQQKMANLPQERVNSSEPFSHTGMDVFGPFMIKRARSLIKRYGLLFTCLCSRAVHVELLDDLTTDSFLNSLRCFLALRGAVKSLHCDQGTNFVGADREIREAVKLLDAEKLERYLSSKQCLFKFNVPHASHAGGVWERQIRSIRAVLNDTIAMCPNQLDDGSLRTLFYEAAYIVNSRPLSPVNLDDPLSEPPITPNHLLHSKSSLVMDPPGKFVKEDLYGRKKWRRVQYMLEQFWSRWRKEYLSNLQVRKKWNRTRRNIKIGDIVLLKETEESRLDWPMGIVTKAIPDDDGHVRKITVRLGNKQLDHAGKGQKRLSELNRPIQKVVLLLESY